MNMINFQIQIFLLALTGFVLGKRKVLDARTRGHLTDLILMAALPCSIIDSFQMTLSAQILMSTLSVLLISIAIQGLYWIWNRLFYRHEGIDRRICLKYATMVSNAGLSACRSALRSMARSDCCMPRSSCCRSGSSCGHTACRCSLRSMGGRS